MLLLVGNHTTKALALGSLAREGEVELVTGGAIVEGDDVVVHTTIAPLINIDIAHSDILMMRLFKTIEVERGIIAYVGLDDLSGQEVTIVSRMVTEEHLDFGTLLEDDKHTTVHHQIGHLTLSIAGSSL